MSRVWPEGNREAARRALAALVVNRTDKGITLDGLHQFASRALLELSNGQFKWRTLLDCIIKSPPRPHYSLEELEQDLAARPQDHPTKTPPLWWLLIPLSLRF